MTRAERAKAMLERWRLPAAFDRLRFGRLIPPRVGTVFKMPTGSSWGRRDVGLGTRSPHQAAGPLRVRSGPVPAPGPTPLARLPWWAVSRPSPPRPPLALSLPAPVTGEPQPVVDQLGLAPRATPRPRPLLDL